MWQKLSQRLTDPIFYQKHGRNLLRPFKTRADGEIREEIDDLFDPSSEGSITVLIAHPDDEIFASGFICEAVARHVSVDIVCLTRGEGGPKGNLSRRELGQRREAELERSAKVLGVRSVAFLDHVDPIGRRYRVFAPPVSARNLATQIRTVLARDFSETRVVLTHGSSGEYWHPAHLLLHRATKRALADTEQAPTLLTMNAWQAEHPLPLFLNRDDPAHFRIEAKGRHEKRLTALECHESQLAFFAQHGGGSHEEFLARMASEAYRIVA